MEPLHHFANDMSATTIDCLVGDILEHVLVDYCHDYYLPCSFVCKRWNRMVISKPDSTLQKNHVMVVSDQQYNMDIDWDDSSDDEDDDEALICLSPTTIALMEIATRGHIRVFQWIAEMKFIRQQHHHALIIPIAEAAAEAGQFNIVQFLISTWCFEVDAVMKAAARGGHENIYQFGYHSDRYVNLRDVMREAVKHNRINMVRIYKEEWKSYASADSIAVAAAEYGRDVIIQLCVDWGVTQWNLIFRAASRAGHLSSLKICMKYAPRLASHEYQNALCIAAERGYMDILLFIHEYLTHSNEYINLDAILLAAAKGGQDAIVQLCIERWNVRATDTLETAVNIAATNGHLHIVELAHRNWDVVVVDVEKTAQTAAEHGHISIVQWCLKHGAKDLREIVRFALINDHMDIATMCKDEWKFNDSNWIIFVAATVGRVNVFNLGCYWGATDFNTAMAEATRYGHIHIMEQCHLHGADNYEQCYEIAKRQYEYECRQLCKIWMKESVKIKK